MVFVASGGGVYIQDVSNPLSPVKVSEKIHTPNVVTRMFYDGSNRRLYISCGTGFEIWDVSNPTNPIRLIEYVTPGRVRGIYVVGSYAFVPYGDSGLRIFDVSDPSNPVEITSLDTPGFAYDVYV